jgi:DNA-directed RNA polymerase specialized sigma24 family protein
MSAEKWTDQEIITAIQSSYKEREHALRYLNSDSGWKTKLIGWVINQGGTLEEAQQVFNETLLTFDKKVRFNDYRGDGTLNAFFTGISKKQWKKVLDERNKTEVDFDLNKHDIAAPNFFDHSMIEEDQIRMLENISAEIGIDCKKVLLLMYFETPYEEIVTYFGLLNVEMAYKKVSRCRKEMHALIDEFPFLKHFFQD